MKTLALLLALYHISQPPPQYDHPYRGMHTVIWMDHDVLVAFCHNAAAAACTRPPRGKGKCLTFISKSWAAYKDLIIRHEIAHCNGWGAAHEGAQ